MTVAVLVMELAVVSLLLGWVWVLMASSPWPAPWVVLLAAPLGLIGGRSVPYSWRRLSWFDGVWWAVVAIVVAVLAEAGNAIAAGESSGARWNVQFVAGLLLAWRGWSLAEGWIDRDLVESELQVGLLVVLSVLVVLIWMAPGAGLLPAVTFAAAGLAGLGLARRAERRDPRGSLEADWIVLLAGLVAVVVGVAAVVVALVTPDVLLILFEQVQTAAGLALAGIGALFAWIASLFPGYGGQPEPKPFGSGAAPVMPTPAAAPASNVPMPPFWLFELLMTFIGVIFLVVAARAIYRLMRMNLRSFDLRIARQRDPSPALSAPEAFSWAGWWRSVWIWLRGWLTGGTASASRAEQARERGGSVVAEARSIRALYRELLAAVARAGFERQPSTTPNELAREVNAARPAVSSSMSTATELYVRARYGEERVGRHELTRMRTAVQQARRDLTPRASQEGGPETHPTGR
jgi:hypothetical protein